MKFALSYRRVAFSCALLLAALLLVSLPHPAQAASSSPQCTQTHTVAAGQSIWRIAKQYSLPARRIGQANRLLPPYRLTPGQTLCIPSNNRGRLDDLSVTFSLTGDQLTVSGSHFLKERAYRLKARGEQAGAWQILGSVFTKKGELKPVVFKLPADLKGQNVLQVCLKDTHTDAISCWTVERK